MKISAKGLVPVFAVVIVLGVLALGGLYLLYRYGSTATSEEKTVALTLDQVKNATYDIHHGENNSWGPVTLGGGIYRRKVNEGIPGEAEFNYSLTIMGDTSIALGDLNNDGKGDAVALVYENTGGTGQFAYLAVLKNISGKPQYSSSVYLDDRPKLQSLRIENGEILLSLIVHGPNDGMCCPTVPREFRYRLVNDRLEEIMENGTNYKTF